MIYFIESSAYRVLESGEREHFILYKIGYASDDTHDKRLAIYKTENPTSRVLNMIVGGNRVDESSLITYLKEKYKPFENGREWFYENKDLYDFMINLDLDGLRKLPVSLSNVRYKNHLDILEDPVKYLITVDYSDPKTAMDCEKYIKDLKLDIIRDLGSDVEDSDKLEDYLINRFGDITKYSKALSDLSDSEKLFIDEYSTNCGTFYEKMKFLCSKEDSDRLVDILGFCDISSCYKYLGRDKCRGLGYHRTKIISHISKKFVKDIDVVSSNPMESLFEIGSKYTVSETKEKLIKGHQLLGSNIKTIKASEIKNYFEVKECYITVVVDGRKKQTRGYKILSKK